jgi:hypothetical protein
MKLCGNNIKYTYKEIKKIINNRGGKLLSNNYINAHLPINIRCNKCKYEWKPKLNNIISGNQWCRNNCSS